MSIFDTISLEEITSIRDFARQRGYHLLLGAGASFGSRNARGALPLAAELVELMAVEYPDAFINPSLSLTRAYQRACLASSSEEVWRFFKQVFSGAQSEQWFHDMSVMPWKTVWTLNVDDSFENAYQATSTSRHPDLLSLAWDDDFIDSADLRLIHLHGHVNGSDPRGLVFSFAEYIKAAKDFSVWNLVLNSLITNEPFVVVGAKLLNDPDVEAMVMGRPSKSRAKSFIVDPFIDDGSKWELENRGFIVVRETAEAFFAEWSARNSLAEAIAQEPALARLRVPQLHERRLDHVARPEGLHDYLGGDPPTWWDACSQNIAEAEWFMPVLDKINTWRSGPASAELVLVYANRLTGLSSLLQWVTWAAADQGVRVFSFDKASRLVPEDLVDLAVTHQPLMVVVDGGSDFVDDIDAALRICSERSDVRMMVVFGEGRSNSLRVEGRLTPSYPKHVFEVPRHVTKAAARTVATKLSERARLGRYEGRPVGEVIRELVKRDIFSGMMHLSFGEGFRHRVAQEFSSLTGWQRDLVLLCSLASIGRREVSLTEAQFACGIGSDAIVAAVQEGGSLSALVEMRDNILVARQRDLPISDFVAEVGAMASLDCLRRFLMNLRPLVNRASLRERNRAATLTGQLMGYKTLRTAFPQQDLGRFYELLESAFGQWNGRYWEQRAIYCKAVRAWPQAESFAARAVSIFPAAYTRTTYGTILLNRAADAAGRGLDWSDFYARGQEQLTLAQDESTERTIAVFAYLGAALDIAREIAARPAGANDDELEKIRSLINDWEGNYAYLRVSLLQVGVGMTSEQRASRLSTSWQEIAGRLRGETPAFRGKIEKAVPGGFWVVLTDGRSGRLNFKHATSRLSKGSEVLVVTVREREDGRLFFRQV